MTDTLIFHSSFDSTRFTALHPSDFPNLAQAQAEAVVSLLLGRSLVVNNTYAFDSRSVLDLIGATLDARTRARQQASSPAGKARIEAASPFILRWYAPREGMNFLACCADQLNRQKPGTRFILSHWKAIDGENAARTELASALTSAEPQPPGFIQQHEELGRSFDTVLRFDEYARSAGRGELSRGPEINLQDYLTNFERLSTAELDRLVAAMSYPIDLDKAEDLRKSIKTQPEAVKKNRGWAHDEVDKAGGEKHCPSFLLEQRQFVDTLYNAVMADSAGSESEFLSSVPRTVSRDSLKLVNGLALELIRYSKLRRSREQTAVDGEPRAEPLLPAPTMSGLFVAAAEEPDLPPSPLPVLLEAYWDLVGDDDLWMAWRDSCEDLQLALRRADRLRLAGRPVDSQLGDKWDAHLDMLSLRLRHIQDSERRLSAAIQLGTRSFRQVNLLEEADRASQAESLATGQYIDRSLRAARR